MDFGMGNVMSNGCDGQYQSMEGYGMATFDGQPSEYNGQDYGQQQAYGGGGMQSFNDESRNCQSGSASFGGPGYRSPLRYTKVMREMNSRNGLYSPTDRSGAGRGNGDYYSSLPGIGGNEPQMYSQQQGGNGGHSYF